METPTEKAICELCGEPMPPGEEMFKFHGFSGPCPKPHVTLPEQQPLSARWQELFWALPPGEMRSKLRALEIDTGRAIREAHPTPPPAALAPEPPNDAVCSRCGAVWGEHIGPNCPDGEGRFAPPPALAEAPEGAQPLSARWQELFWALPPGEMRHKLRALEIDTGRAIRDQQAGALKEASQALDELTAPDPSKSLAQRIRDEFADFQMVIRHCSEIYDHVTHGRISKPTTLPSVVQSVADDLITEACDEAVKEHTAELQAEFDQQAGALGRLRETLQGIADANPREWDDGFNTDTEFRRWAQSRARAALAASAPEGEQP